MPSGNRRLVYNTRERLLSTDHNREQQFLGADVASLLARTHLAVYEGDEGVSTLATSVGTPPAALILDGLMFAPIDGSTSALVSAGSVSLVDPDAVPSPDDVPFKWVHSDGVPTIGVLVLSANPGGIRIDVVEFRRVVEVVEFDNRDQFNPTTGLFTPVNVPKVERGALEFRIRLGVVGSSFPGVVAGWTPIAVVRVPAVANTWDDTTVWDVRPLLADRWAGGGSDVEHSIPRIGRINVSTDILTAPGEQRIFGRIDAELLESRIGGTIRSAVPGTQTDWIDIEAAANQEGAGIVPVPLTYWYLYLLFPYALPRWVRYSDPGFGGRAPSGLRGLPVVSLTEPNFDGTPSATVAPPGSTNLQNGGYMAGGPHPALCVLAGQIDALGGLLFVTADGMVLSGRGSTDQQGVLGVTAGPTTTFAYVSGVDFPENARSIRVRAQADLAATGAAISRTNAQLRISNNGATVVDQVQRIGSFPIVETFAGGESLVSVSFEADIPLEPSFAGTPRSFEIRWDHGTIVANTTLTNVFMKTMAWTIRE